MKRNVQLSQVISTTIKQQVAPSAMTPVLDGFRDGVAGDDNSASVIKKQAAGAASVLVVGTVSAGVAGAGALTAYAGVTTTVATLGFGGAVTGLASAAGLTAASGAPLVGAAATSAVTALVGGPVIAGALLIGTVAAGSYGLYKAATWIGAKLTGRTS